MSHLEKRVEAVEGRQGHRASGERDWYLKRDLVWREARIEAAKRAQDELGHLEDTPANRIALFKLARQYQEQILASSPDWKKLEAKKPGSAKSAEAYLRSSDFRQSWAEQDAKIRAIVAEQRDAVQAKAAQEVPLIPEPMTAEPPKPKPDKLRGYRGDDNPIE